MIDRELAITLVRPARASRAAMMVEAGMIVPFVHVEM